MEETVGAAHISIPKHLHTDILTFFLSSLPHLTFNKVTNLWQTVHPPLTSVLHEVCQPLLPVICLLLTEGLEQNIHNTAFQLLYAYDYNFNLILIF